MVHDAVANLPREVQPLAFVFELLDDPQVVANDYLGDPEQSWRIADANAAMNPADATATIATNTVTWDGVVPAGGSVTVTIQATIQPWTAGTTITNQAAIAFKIWTEEEPEPEVLREALEEYLEL